MITLLLTIYDFLWRVALPFLRKKPRLALGWQQRTMADAPSGPFDLWIQSASGGESMLTAMILQNLSERPDTSKKINILATSGTKQGIDSLRKGWPGLDASRIALTISYFPFDAPHLMQQAFDRFRPRLIVTVETEMWPAQLIFAKKNNIPVLLVNGRISDKSKDNYRRFSRFFRKWGPDRVWAISDLDKQRFETILGANKVELMNNIKFDRIAPVDPDTIPNPLAAIIADDYPFVLLGSIRREEENQILEVIGNLLQQRHDIVIGLFPKHIERTDHWLQSLQAQHIQAVRRSAVDRPQSPGKVIVWDTFGELAGAYGLARACFVGGSLVNLGGQNFLEPLVFGLRPIIGPYWQNFAWVGREIVDAGLVVEVANQAMLTEKLLTAIDSNEPRQAIRNRVQAYFEPRQGGTKQVTQQLYAYLQQSGN